MRSSMAYFAGAGTVAIAVAAGLGGGLVIANIMSPHAPKQELSKLERHATPEPSPSTRDPLVPVPYMAATRDSSNAAVVVSPASQAAPGAASASSAPAQTTPAQPTPAQPTPAQATQTEAAQTSATQPPDVTASKDQAATPSEVSQSEVAKSNAPKASEPKALEASTAKPASPASSPMAPQPGATRDQVPAPDDAYAKAREVDARRTADRRKGERRQQQWVERRRYPMNREQELRDVEARVRESTEPRDYEERPVRVEYPQVRLFGPE
jgi:hypothetical protein